MASSPPAPSLTALPNPKKRPSLGPPSATSGSSYSVKRPKLHPLRQTSFPASNASPFSATPSARSETGSVSNSLVSGLSGTAGTGEKRRRGRPRKNNPKVAQDGAPGAPNDGLGVEEGGSLVSGRGGAGRGTKSVASGRSGAGDAEDDDEGEWGVSAPDLDAADKQRQLEEEREENMKLSRLISVFTPEQEHRYNMYKRSTLNKSTLKRIVNQTVSQSVTALPLIAIGSYSKFFVGEIVTRACDVQREWANAFDKAKELEAEGKSDEERSKIKSRPNPHRGGLLPDHLREALRRYKGDGDGGGVGLGSTSLGMMGSQGSGSWRVGNGIGGRRLFR